MNGHDISAHKLYEKMVSGLYFLSNYLKCDCLNYTTQCSMAQCDMWKFAYKS